MIKKKARRVAALTMENDRLRAQLATLGRELATADATARQPTAIVLTADPDHTLVVACDGVTLRIKTRRVTVSVHP